jgi:hypothetical protein
LVLGDRGYCNPPNVALAAEQGAAVLLRYNRGALPLWTTAADRFDVLAGVRRLAEAELVDLPVFVVHREELIRGRFIATRLPEREAVDARKRVRKEYGAKASQEMLEAAGYVMLFTTVPRERLSAAMCLHAYQLRWQIELQFKRWKSLCGFDRLPNYRDDTIVAWLYAKVLLGLVLDRMTSGDELSPPVQLAVIPQRPRRRRRARTAADGASALEANERAVSDDRRSTAPAVAT